MSNDRDVTFMALLVWMAPAAFATDKGLYYVFGFLILLMFVLAEIAHLLQKRADRLRARLEETQQHKSSNASVTGLAPEKE